MGRIVQFGTSRFLQAHVDLFVHEAREAGQDVGPVTIVKTTPPSTSGRDGRIAAFGAPGGYPVIIRGLVGGAEVDRTVMVRAVDRGISAHAEWSEVVRLFVGEADIAVSNTGDTGYAMLEQDGAPPAAGETPAGFPAKLLALLLARHAAGGRPLSVLPCELISGNGRTLRAAVGDLARRWSVADAFLEWLDRDVIFANTLVDRIVSAAIEPVGAVAEPYALWAIQRVPGLAAPMLHPDVVMTDALEPYERLKLHILNLGHTYLAEIWRVRQLAPDATVRGMLDDAGIRESLRRLYDDEVVPGFAARGLGAEAERYVATTMERFANPFLDHLVADIAQHHAVKIERRVGAFLDWSGRRDHSPRLAELQREG